MVGEKPECEQKDAQAEILMMGRFGVCVCDSVMNDAIFNCNLHMGNWYIEGIFFFFF